MVQNLTKIVFFQVPKWLEDNKLEYLVKDIPCEESKVTLSPTEVESKLLQLMNADETCECVRGWIQVTNVLNT